MSRWRAFFASYTQITAVFATMPQAAKCTELPRNGNKLRSEAHRREIAMTTPYNPLATFKDLP